MRDFILVTGMILETGPVNDYDRRLVILTKDRGKITAFAKGARRPGNKLMAATNPFCFGNFKLMEGKTAYNLIEAEIVQYFEELRSDYDSAYLGMYFLELASYYTRENNDDMLVLKLLYQSIRALVKQSLNNDLVRQIYEIKMLVVNGLYPGIPQNISCCEGTKYTVDFIVNTNIEKLYTFAVNDQVLEELKSINEVYKKRFYDKEFKSLKLLNDLSSLNPLNFG